jgi:RNA polymerase sigma factor, sigma-70 family/RNA polymerase sigma-70 factor, Bacteroides expansion family 1
MLLTIDIEKFRQGDQKIFEKVYDCYQKPLLHFARTFIHVEAAEEVVSDAFFGLWKHRIKIANDRHLKSFLYVTVKNMCIDVLRNVKSLATLPIDDFDFANEKPEILVKILYADLLMHLEQKLQKLPNAQQKVFRMSILEGMSTEEITRETNMSAESIFVQKSKAISSLRKSFVYNPLMLILLQYLIDHR